MNLRNHNILFIAPRFYDYHIAIKSKMEEYGAEVTFYPEVSNNIIYLICRNLGGWFHSAFQKYYYNHLYLKIKKQKFDLFFLIKGEGIPVAFVQKLKEKNPGIYFLTYLWDSILNFDCRYLIGYFDEAFTFDPADSEEYNIRYYPTFVRDEVLANRKNCQNFSRETFDLLLIGGYQKARYEFLKKMIPEVKRNNINLYHHLYIPLIPYIYQNLTGNRIEKKYIKFNTLQFNEILSLYSKSKCIIDIGHKNQTGITMRIYEALGSGKKVLTNCETIKKTEYFSVDNICIIDTEDFTLPLDFIKRKSYDTDISALSLNNWITTILGNFLKTRELRS